MNQERIDSYRSEITHWISKQGFLFQLLKAPRLLGSSAGVFSYLVGVLLKLIAVAIVIALIGVFIISTSHNKPKFTAQITEKIKSSLLAENVELKNTRGGFFSNVEVPELSMDGSDGSFFEKLKIQNADFRLGSFISRKSVFETDAISCSRIDAHMKIASGSGESEKPLFAPLFDTNDWFRFNYLEARTLNCKWGYSERTAGEIKGARMEMVRSEDSLIVEIEGGTLSYSWLKDVNVESIKMLLKKDHFEISEAKFNKNGATFNLNLKCYEFGANPKVKGNGEIYNCNTGDVFKSDFIPLVSGLINSEFSLDGSPNSPEGLTFKFIPLITESKIEGVSSKVVHPNKFKLKHAIPLWRALTTLDSSTNYRAYEFNDTSWELELKGDELFLKDGHFSNKRDSKVKLLTSFAIKEPTDQYIDNAVNVPDSELRSLLLRPGLKGKARELLRLKGDISSGGVASFDALDRSDFSKLLRGERHFNGECRLSLQAESFSSKERLKAAFPVQSGRRNVPVSLSGPIEQVTQVTAQQLYELGKEL